MRIWNPWLQSPYQTLITLLYGQLDWMRNLASCLAIITSFVTSKDWIPRSPSHIDWQMTSQDCKWNPWLPYLEPQRKFWNYCSIGIILCLLDCQKKLDDYTDVLNPPESKRNQKNPICAPFCHSYRIRLSNTCASSNMSHPMMVSLQFKTQFDDFHEPWVLLFWNIAI